MSVEQAVWLLLITAIVLANAPWFLPNKIFIFIKFENKSFIVNFAEWFVYFILMGALARLLETRVMGSVAPQDWEFYAITFFMFVIFAFPGFIYRYNLKAFLEKNSLKKS